MAGSVLLTEREEAPRLLDRPGVRRLLRVPGRSWLTAGLVAALAMAAVLRTLRIDALGYNSDEAVYAGQAASLAGNPHYVDQFPVFRAHPLLVQSLLSLVYRHGEADAPGRLVEAAIGVATVFAVYLLGRELYDGRVGVLAAWILAVMPYHVVVSRQVLLDGPMVFLATVTLLLVARYSTTQRIRWFLAAGACMGLTMLAKETSVVLLGAVYAFFALTPHLKRQLLASLLAIPVLVLVFAAYPIAIAASGHSSTGKSYLVWQLLRRSNHPWTFYGSVLPAAIGWAVLAVALAGLVLLRRHGSWRETLLASWILVPIVAFEAWPVKGFQYLLAIAPPLAVLAARALVRIPLPEGRWSVPVRAAVAAVVVVSLLVPSWRQVTSTDATTFLAGSGGVPGGRAAGRWVDTHTPKGSVFMTLGPSMANIVEFYGHRTAYGLSVSSNPLHRNPVYAPIPNPDRALRDVTMQYVVWDAYSASRSPFFARHEAMLVRRYHGRAVHTETVTVRSADGVPTQVPVIIVYEVSPWPGR